LYNEGLDSTLWPYHTKPREDELLSSWLVRLAAGNGLKLHTFSSMAWPGVSLWNRDVDNLAPEIVINLLSIRTGTARDIIRETTIAGLTGRLFEDHHPNGLTAWVLPVGVYHRTRHCFGTQCCPVCLRESAHYRRRWRLAFSTVCTKHRVELFDRCPGCKTPIVFHRNDLGDRNAYDAALPVHCHECGMDWSAQSAPRIAPNATILRFQRELEAVLDEGTGMIGGEKIFSLLYFAGLRMLTMLLSSGWAARLLRAELSQRIGIEPFQPKWRGNLRMFEHLSVSHRRCTLALASRLLEDWPNEFEHVAKRVGLTSSYLLKREDVPYWYWRVVRDRFYRPAYVPNVDEIKAVATYLRGQGEEPTRLNVARHLGNRELFRKRSLEHLLR
jgi:hypothetical protein